MATKADEKIIIDVVSAIQKVNNSTQHQKIARTYLQDIAFDMVEMVEYYDDLRVKQPAVYLDHVTSGKMARSFRIAFERDRNSSLDVLIFTQHNQSLLTMKKAIKACEGNEQLTDEQIEASAINVLRTIVHEGTSKTQVRKKVAERALNLHISHNDNEEAELLASNIDSLLSAPYLR
jgi:hypothetical protein